jgi:Trehalose utilisation
MSIVLISGDEEYRSEEALPMLGRLLSQRFGFRCTVLFAIDPDSGAINPDCQTNLPGLELLAEADLVIMALRFRQPPDDQMQWFDEYVQSGKPIIGLRTSTHAFAWPSGRETSFRRYSYDSDEWPGGFGKKYLGETWVNHHGQHGSQSTRGVVDESAKDHPLLRGVEGVWGPTDVYGIRTLPDDAIVLLRGQVLDGMKPDAPPAAGKVNEPMMPLAWCRELPLDDDRTPQRIFTTTMGAATDFIEPGLRRLVVNAVWWCLRKEEQIDPLANIGLVDDYSPSGFGFGGFRKGVRIGDLPDGK